MTAACYDPRNLCVWTTNDDWIDVWNCAGKVKVSSHHLDERLGKLEQNSDPQLEQNEDNSHTLCITSAISFLLRHIGVESCRLVPGLEFPNLVLHSLPLSFLSQCCDLLGSSVAVESWGNVQVIIVTLQVGAGPMIVLWGYYIHNLLGWKINNDLYVWFLLYYFHYMYMCITVLSRACNIYTHVHSCAGCAPCFHQ